MGLTKPALNSTVFTNNSKVKALEISLHQSITNFKELLLDLQQLHIDSENYKLQYLLVKEKCINCKSKHISVNIHKNRKKNRGQKFEDDDAVVAAVHEFFRDQEVFFWKGNFRLRQKIYKVYKPESKTCEGVEDLKKNVATKDNIIQAVASILTKLNETKDFNLLSDAFKVLFEEVAILTPPTEDSSLKTCPSLNSNKADSPVYENTIPYDEDTSMIEDVSHKEESLNEIESTPTGRKSPILQTRKAKSVLTKTDVRDKKKCPDNWPTPERKAVKLIFPSSRSTPKTGKKPRQTRLKLATVKSSTVVDLTCSPDVQQKQEQLVQPLIKKESMEEDTILPSPTSGPANIDLFKSISKPSPSKFKRPNALSLKNRCEQIKQDENKDTSNNIAIDMDVSVNILNQFANKLRDIKKGNTAQKDSPVKKENCSTPIKIEKGTPVKKEKELVKMDVTDDDDATNASISMQDMEAIELLEKDINLINMLPSPLKRPLAENKNILNTPPKNEPESSISILRPDTKPAAVEAVKRTIPEPVEPVHKEPAVRKKAEKKNLQGWSCEECMNFYGVLYKNDPVMLSKKVQECSKHRGRHNPVRPKTPPNFWNPRWTVPDDTEELNRMNHAN